jgi:hypothetical protein
MSQTAEFLVANPETSNKGRDFLGLQHQRCVLHRARANRSLRTDGRGFADQSVPAEPADYAPFARSRPGTGGAAPAIRNSAVAPTATAPKIENAICQPSECMRCVAIPCVAA